MDGGEKITVALQDHPGLVKKAASKGYTVLLVGIIGGALIAWVLFLGWLAVRLVAFFTR